MTEDLYGKIAKAEGIDRKTVKAIAMPFMYSETPFFKLEELITNAVRSFKKNGQPSTEIPDLPKGMEIKVSKNLKPGTALMKNGKQIVVIENIDYGKLEERIMVDQKPQSLAQVEKAHIIKVLNYHNGNKRQAAFTLGIAIKTLYNKLEYYDIESKKNTEIVCPVVEEAKRRGSIE